MGYPSRRALPLRRRRLGKLTAPHGYVLDIASTGSGLIALIFAREESDETIILKGDGISWTVRLTESDLGLRSLDRLDSGELFVIQTDAVGSDALSEVGDVEAILSFDGGMWSETPFQIDAKAVLDCRVRPGPGLVCPNIYDIQGSVCP